MLILEGSSKAALYRAINEKYNLQVSISIWNDMPGRTQDQVIAAFHYAIDKCYVKK